MAFVIDIHSDSIRLNALTFLILANIYILSLYVPSCFLASYFIYYTHINIASMPVLTIYSRVYLSNIVYYISYFRILISIKYIAKLKR